MALGTSTVSLAPNYAESLVTLSSYLSDWVTVVEAGGITTVDGAFNNPNTQPPAARPIASKGAKGSYLELALGYDPALTGITAPRVRVFGRTSGQNYSTSNTAGRWQLLKTISGLNFATLTPAADDVSDGTYKYTTCDQQIHRFDIQGCDQLIVLVDTALAATGTVATAFVQGKVL